MKSLREPMRRPSAGWIKELRQKIANLESEIYSREQQRLKMENTIRGHREVNDRQAADLNDKNRQVVLVAEDRARVQNHNVELQHQVRMLTDRVNVLQQLNEHITKALCGIPKRTWTDGEVLENNQLARIANEGLTGR